MSSGNTTSQVKSMTYARNRNKQKERGQERRSQFTPRKRTSESEDDGTCDLCVQTIKIYSLGHCDHPICYRCSAKMRVLCEQNHCAVCRVEMKKVIYCQSKRPFDEANDLRLLPHKKNNVWFTNEIVKKEYEKLFDHGCPICPGHPVETSFDKLEAHMRKDHKLFYCALCIRHNTNFTDECKTYSREGLAKHRRVGDDDDTSHKGHPICEFCDERYLDKDALLSHLRKDHYFCHFCDQEGRNQYYDGYVDLRDHYRKEHFLCEEDDCINEQFTSVFATELDLKGHRAATHMHSVSRQQQKAERNIDLGFQYANPPARGGRVGSGRGRGRGGGRNENSKRDDDLELAKALSLAEQNVKKERDNFKGDRPKIQRDEQRKNQPKGDRPKIQRDEQRKNQPEAEEPSPLDLVNDFPTLGAPESVEQRDPFAYISIHKQPPKPEEKPPPQEAQSLQPTTASRIAAAVGISVGSISHSDFPTLGSNNKPGATQPTGKWGASTTSAPGKSASAKIQKPVSVNKPQSKFSKLNVYSGNKEEFPTLGGVSGSSTSFLATIWGSSAPSSSSRKEKKAKTPIANQEAVKHKVKPPKMTPTITHERKPAPKSTPAVVHDSTQIIYDDTVSIRIGSHKHTMRLTSTSYSDQIADIEKPIEVPGVGATSVKTVSADTFSLLSTTANSPKRSTTSTGENFASHVSDFPELGSGQGGRIRGIGTPKPSSATWGQSSSTRSEKPKKSKFSLSNLSKDIVADDVPPKANNPSKKEKSIDVVFTEKDFPLVTKPPPLSSYAATWHDQGTTSVADQVAKEGTFEVQEGDFPNLATEGTKNSKNAGKKNKKKKKNKGQPSINDLSKHFGAVVIENSEPGQGHLQNLFQDQKGKKSLSAILDEDNMFAPVQNGGVKTEVQVQSEVPASKSTPKPKPASKSIPKPKPASKSTPNKKVHDEESQDVALDPRPDENDIQGRNIWLINTIQQSCGNEENFSEFKYASGGFRQGTMSAEGYYEKCRTLLGKTRFDEVFKELVALLPDPDKQEALMAVHGRW